MPDRRPGCRGCPDHLPSLNACHWRVRKGASLIESTTPASGRPVWCPRADDDGKGGRR